MPQGERPQSAGIALAPGLWKAPRWGGVETRAAAVLFSLEIVPIVFRSWQLMVVTTLMLGFWWYALSRLFLRDERFLAIFIKTRHFHRLPYLRGASLVSTPHETLRQVY